MMKWLALRDGGLQHRVISKAEWKYSMVADRTTPRKAAAEGEVPWVHLTTTYMSTSIPVTLKNSITAKAAARGVRPAGAIECDGQIMKSHPNAEVLGAYLDAILAGVNESDASDIAKEIERRPRPTYEERMAVEASAIRDRQQFLQLSARRRQNLTDESAGDLGETKFDSVPSQVSNRVLRLLDQAPCDAQGDKRNLQYSLARVPPDERILRIPRSRSPSLALRSTKRMSLPQAGTR